MGRSRLPKKVLSSIVQLCDEADALAARREDLPAYEKLTAAWDLVPEDKGLYAVSRRILTSVGDIQFRRGKWEKALISFLRAVQCPDGLGDPHIHMRIGQCQFEIGQMTAAGDELARAYMGGGRDVFVGEDPKYFSLVEQLLQPPPGMDRLP